jgi:tetratricopeptide (TPR) repeat protein
MSISSNLWLKLFNIGNAHYYRNEYEEAIECYNEAINLSPNSEEIWTKKGSALDKLGRGTQALTMFDKAFELNPLNRENAILRMHLQSQCGLLLEVIESCNNILWLSANNIQNDIDFTLEVDILEYKQSALMNLGHYEDYLEVTNMILKRTPTNISYYGEWSKYAHCKVLGSLGQYQMELEKYEEAAMSFEKAVNCCEEHSAWYYLTFAGFSYEAGGMYQEAIKKHEQVFEIKGELENLFSKLRLLIIMGKYEQAEIYYDKLVEMDPKKIRYIINQHSFVSKTRD